MKKRPVFRPRFIELFSKRENSFSLGTEITAGITVGLIALPLALALGIASIPSGTDTPLPAPAIGIFTAVIGGFLVALLGGSRVQIGGPTAAFIPIVLLIVSEHGYSGLLVATMMAGVILMIMGVTRMGSLIKFIPWPVTSGFTTGIAVAIMLTQVPDFAGLKTETAMPREFFEKIPWIFEHLDLSNPYSLSIAILCVVVILFWPRLKLRFIPGSIAAMLLATVLVSLLGWSDAHGIATIGSKFGANAFSAHFPTPSLPQFDWNMVRELIGPATAIALLGAIESLLSAVVADGLSGDHHDSNTELIAQGFANFLCPFFGGLPVTGAIARTSANINNGGKTPLAGIIHAIALLSIILVAANWVIYIPMAAMSAVLIVVALKMGEWHELSRLPKLPRSDAIVMLTTFALTVIFDLVVAVEIGMVLAAILFIKRVSQTTEVSQVTGNDMLERPEQIAQGKEIPEGVLVYRIFGPFLFGAAEKMEDALSRIDSWPNVLILRLHLVTAMDATGMHALVSLVERMKNHQGKVILSGIHQQPLQMLKKSGFINTIGRENFCATFDDSLIRAKELSSQSEA
ncbi:SulP family inorganic anion transporter [Pelagicoccus albus]|uniref:STAS domain-containing protein n=1 Tax=Pelagicoccus albus TaxID=415222 RepID=A0A7X1B8V2_9BACT|nr:SulP family inorganic anion transporter [Pelagicoccus albus]MBC2607796.1 STAS domain-containing protein [Pelagicoccus albus]